MTWRKFAAGAPDMAEFGREEFEHQRVAVIGTIRRDGSPRLGNVEPCILDGELYLGMLWHSHKALDLRRDPRIVLRNAICSSTGNERELTLSGRAIEIHQPDVRRRYQMAVAHKIAWREPHFHLFAVDIERASMIRYGHGQQSVKLWPQGIAFERPYG